MTKHDQREIWAFKSKHPEIKDVPDALLFVIFRRAKEAIVSDITRKRRR